MDFLLKENQALIACIQVHSSENNNCTMLSLFLYLLIFPFIPPFLSLLLYLFRYFSYMSLNSRPWSKAGGSQRRAGGGSGSSQDGARRTSRTDGRFRQSNYFTKVNRFFSRYNFNSGAVLNRIHNRLNVCSPWSFLCWL